MNAVMMRVGWVAVAAAAVAFTSYTFFGSAVTSSAEESLQTVVIRDSFEGETHELHGMVTVPSDCYDLSVYTQEVNERAFELAFETWKQPYRDCQLQPTPRAFKVVVFAPLSTAFSASLDGEPLRIRVLREE